MAAPPPLSSQAPQHVFPVVQGAAPGTLGRVRCATSACGATNEFAFDLSAEYNLLKCFQCGALSRVHVAKYAPGGPAASAAASSGAAATATATAAAPAAAAASSAAGSAPSSSPSSASSASAAAGGTTGGSSAGGGGGGGGGSGKGLDGRTVKDTSLYELLGVEPDATSGQVKKAYYLKARQWHPDKNPDDPEAEAKFQKLSEAYQVLSDDEQRKRYDAHGVESVVGPDAANFVDAQELFNNIFGGAAFSDIVGDMFLGALASDGELSPEERDRLMTERVQKLSEKLKERLALWEAGNHAAFTQKAVQEVKDLSGEINGVDIFHTAGYIYESEAKRVSGGISGFFADVSATGHAVKGTVGAVNAAVKAQNAAKAHETAVYGSEEAKAAAEQRLMEEGLRAMWLVGKLEVEQVLKQVCNSVLRGPEINAKTQRARAAGLKELGRVYRTAVAPPGQQQTPFSVPHPQQQQQQQQ